VPADVSDPDPLAFADAPSHPPVDVAQQAQVEKPRIDIGKQNRLRVTDEEPGHFGDDVLPRPPRIHERTIRVRSQSKNEGDRARDERESEVNPFSKDCGGHESATN
nr:hypothetical protein [Tanacetum cinerariifolium]